MPQAKRITLMKDGQMKSFNSEYQARQKASERFTGLPDERISNRQLQRMKAGGDWNGVTVVATEVPDCLTFLPCTSVRQRPLIPF